METFNDVISADRLVLVDFFATWCQPCKMMQPVLAQLKETLGDKVRIIKYGIQAVPTLMLFRRGQMLWRQSGMASRSDLLAVIRQHL